MVSARLLNDHLRRAVTGPMWHGPAAADTLDGVTAAQAAAHPIAGAHSIWELVLHLTVWAEIAAARLDGRAQDSPDAEQDWARPRDAGEAAWRAAVQRLGAAYAALADRVTALEEKELRATVAGQEHPVWAMLLGVVEHACYHGGQISLLRRALQAQTDVPPAD